MKTSKRTPNSEERLIELSNVTGIVLGKVLGLSAVHISRLNSEGVIKQNGKGQAKYDLTEAVPMYIEKKSRSGTASAKALLAVQQERKLRLINDREAGTVVALDDAADALLRCCLVWRSGAAALPRRLAPKAVILMTKTPRLEGDSSLWVKGGIAVVCTSYPSPLDYQFATHKLAHFVNATAYRIVQDRSLGLSPRPVGRFG